MKPLWAPWRLSFIAEKDEGCIFCKKPSQPDSDETNLIYERKRLVFGMLNKYPYNSGHLLIAPFRHVTSFHEITVEEWLEIMALTQESIEVLNSEMHPEGYNIGFNLGKAAGAGFDHIHLHIVPRWNGDTNFMPVLAETKVMPEHLNATYKKIRKKFDEKGKGS